MFACSEEANAKYPDIYESLQVPEDQQSLPRFGSLRQDYNEWNFDEQTTRWGMMKTSEEDLDPAM